MSSSRMRAGGAGRSSLAAALLFLGVLLAGVAASGLADATRSQAIPELGLVQIPLAPGVHTLALPVQPASPDDLPALMDASLLELESLESWDPATRQFRACYPRRPDAAAGEMALASRVIRVTLDHPVLLRLRGTGATTGLDAQVAGVVSAGYFGLLTTAPVSAGALLDALERGNPFVRARDELWMWDLSSARWVEVRALAADRAIPAATAFCVTPKALAGGTPGSGGAGGNRTGAAPLTSLPPPTGASPPPGADGIARAAPQAAPRVDGAVSQDGTVVRAGELGAAPPPTPAPAGCAFTNYRYKGEVTRPSLGVADMTLPADLCRVTDLPTTTPVRIWFKTGTADVSLVEVLGLTQLGVGNTDRITLRSASKDPKRPNVALWVDAKGQLYGAGLADLPAHSGTGASYDDATGRPVASGIALTDQKVAVLFAPAMKIAYADGERAAGAISLTAAANPEAKASLYWTTSPALFDAGIVQADGAGWRTRDFWLNLPGKVTGAFTLGQKLTWTGDQMPAALRTPDGKTLAAIDALGVTSAKLVVVPKLPLVGKTIPDIPIGGIGESPIWALRFPAAEAPSAELVRDTFFSVKLWDGKFIYSIHPEPDAGFELEVSPTPTYAFESDGFRIGAAPRITLRGRDFAKTDAGYWEDLFLTVMVQGNVRADVDWNYFVPDNLQKLWRDLKILFFPITGLVKLVQWFRSDTKGLDFWVAFGGVVGGVHDFFTKQLHIGGYSLSVGVGSVARIHDVGTTNENNRLSLYGTFTTKSERTKIAYDKAAQKMEPSFLSALTTVTNADAFVLTPLKDNFDVRAGALYERFASPPLSFGIDVQHQRRLAKGTSQSTSIRVGASYELPRSWGWAQGRAASGVWVLSNARAQADPTAKELRANRYEFQVAELFTFSGRSLDLPGELGDFDVELSDLRFHGSAAERADGSIARDFLFHGSLMAGSIPVEGSTTGTRAGVLDVLCRRSSVEPASTASPELAPTSATLASLTQSGLFAGPPARSRFLEGESVRVQLDGSFSGIGSDRVRLETVSGSYVTSGPRMMSVGMGFRTSSGPQWGHLELAVAKSRYGWSGGGYLGDLRISDVVQLNRASVFVKQPGPQPKPFWKRVVVGAELGFDAKHHGSFTDAGIAAGLNLDVDTRVASVFLNLTSDLWPGAGAVLKSTGLDGTVDFADAGAPAWDINATALLTPPWSEETKPASVAVRFAGKPVPRDEVGAKVTGLIPTIPIYEEGKIELASVGLAYRRDTRSFDYEGDATVTLPAVAAVDFSPFLTVPAVIKAKVTGNTKSKLVLLSSFDRPLSIGLNEKLSIQVKTFRFQKGSPFQLGMDASLVAGGASVPLNCTFDSKDSSFAMQPSDPNAEVSFGVGAVTVKLSKFSLKLSKQAGKGFVTISGFAAVTVDGRTVSGTATITVDAKKDMRIALTGLSGTTLDLGSDLGGFKISADSFSVDSTVDESSGARTTTASSTVSLEFPSDWPGIGGQKVTGSLATKKDGFEVAVLSPLDLGFSGFPVEIVIEKLTISKTGKDFGAGGSARVRFLRPINTVLGVEGDDPVEFSADISLTKDKKIKFAVKLEGRSDLVAIPFNMKIASGTLRVKELAVSSGPDCSINLELALTKPGDWLLTCIAALKGQSFSFHVTSKPPLASDYHIVGFSFTDLSYDQIFPGFMAVGATYDWRYGYDYIYRISTSVKNLQYVLPSSFPPFGFPFFDRFGWSMKILGFGAAASVAMKAPKMPSLAFALKFVKHIATGFRDDDWDPLRLFLRQDGGDQLKSIFPGPGLGELALGFPQELRSVFPMLPVEKLLPTDFVAVSKLTIIPGFHYLTDLISTGAMADAIVDALQFVAAVGKIFSDPRYIVELIPKSKRHGSVDFSFVGSAAIKGAYAVQETEDIAAQGSAASLPQFGLLANLATLVSQSSVAPSMMDVIMLRKPLFDAPFKVTHDNGTEFTGSIKDTWIELRSHVEQAIALKDMACTPDELFSGPRALQRHLERAVGEHGAFTQVQRQMVSADGKVQLTLTGSSAPFEVKQDGASVFAGSVPLFRTTTAATPQGTLALTASVAQESQQLTVIVTGAVQPVPSAEDDAKLAVWQATANAYEKWKYANDVWQQYLKLPDGQTPSPPPQKPGPAPQAPGPKPAPASRQPKQLGVVSKRLLFDIERGVAAATAEQGRLVDWNVTYYLTDNGAIKASYASLGTMRFNAPNVEFTWMYRGSMLPDLRLGLKRMLALRDVVFGAESSPYMLGLTVWGMLFNDPAFKGSIDRITSNGRRVEVGFKDSPLTLAVVLDEIGYFLTPPPGQSGGTQLASLSGAADLASFTVDDTRLLARPFTVSITGVDRSKDAQQVKDLVVFDGGPAVWNKVKDARAPGRMEPSDISKLVGHGLSAFGDPMVVKALKLEIGSGQIAVTVRPKNVSVARRLDGAELFAITPANEAALDRLSKTGSPSDQTEYPAVPGTFKVNRAVRAPVKGQPLVDVDTTQPITDVNLLHTAIGSNVLFRDVTVVTPAGIAGTYAMIARNLLQGRVKEAFEVVADPVTGMTAHLNARPSEIAVTRDVNGSTSGTIIYANAERPVTFKIRSAALQEDFSFATGEVQQGGFFASLHLRLAPAGIGFDADVSGEIRFNGYFNFQGGVQLVVLDRRLANGSFKLSSSDGLIVTGLLDIYIAAVDTTAAISASGASLRGDVNVGRNGTGIFGSLSAGFPGDSAFNVQGQLRIVGHTIASGRFRIANDGTITCSWSLGGDTFYISATLTFRFKGGASVGGYFSACVDTGAGTISAGMGASISDSGDVSMSFFPVSLRFNIATGSCSVSVDTGWLSDALDAIEDFFSSW